MMMNLGKSNHYFQSSKLIKESTTVCTTYYPENMPKVKTIVHYNVHNKPTVELRYDEKDVLKQRVTITYDNSGTFDIGVKLENSDPEIGFYTVFSTNQYDSNGLVNKITESDEKGGISKQADLVYNEKGNPTEIIVSIGDVMLSKQTAVYNYELNEATIKYFNRKGELYNTQKVPIDYSIAKPGEIVNEYGDIIKSATSEIEIAYDEFGNWTKKVYSMIIDGKLTKSSEQIRTLLYVN